MVLKNYFPHRYFKIHKHKNFLNMDISYRPKWKTNINDFPWKANLQLLQANKWATCDTLSGLHYLQKWPQCSSSLSPLQCPSAAFPPREDEVTLPASEIWTGLWATLANWIWKTVWSFWACLQEERGGAVSNSPKMCVNNETIHSHSSQSKNIELKNNYQHRNVIE